MWESAHDPCGLIYPGASPVVFRQGYYNGFSQSQGKHLFPDSQYGVSVSACSHAEGLVFAFFFANLNINRSVWAYLTSIVLTGFML